MRGLIVTALFSGLACGCAQSKAPQTYEDLVRAQEAKDPVGRWQQAGAIEDKQSSVMRIYSVNTRDGRICEAAFFDNPQSNARASEMNCTVAPQD